MNSMTWKKIFGLSMRYPIIWRKLSALSLISAAICYRLTGTNNEISIQWTWPLHFLVVIAATVAIVDFMKKRHESVLDLVDNNPSDGNIRGRKLLFGTTIFLTALLLLVLAVATLNLIGPGFISLTAETVFYISWLCFSIFTVLYFWFFLPIADRYLDEEFGSRGFI